MPSYKFIHSLGTLYKKKGKVDRSTLEEISINIWERCVLCTRCYCPFGIDIPSMIALARSSTPLQGVFRRYDEVTTSSEDIRKKISLKTPTPPP